MKRLVAWLLALLLRRKAAPTYVEHCLCHDLPVDDCPRDDL